MEKPDVWVTLKISQEGKEDLYKVLVGWYGGYLGADEWRINSGIKQVKQDEHNYYFYGASGSCYKCNKGNEKLSGLTASTYEHYKAKLEKIGVKMEIVPVETVVQVFDLRFMEEAVKAFL